MAVGTIAMLYRWAKYCTLILPTPVFSIDDDEDDCHEPCTATTHGRPTLLCTDVSHTLWTWLSYVPCKRKMAVRWSLGFVGFIRFHSHKYPFHFDSF